MASGLLSLKWNNHKSTFFHVLSSIRSKESYCDATLACDGRFYPVHKLVLSTCSEYFEQIFERTQCKHPVIVLKDIKFEDLEALMNYMYVGEVNVLQEKLSGLIKAAECLKIKGLAVPDEDPFTSKENRRNQHRAEFESPRAKRRRREDSFPSEERAKNVPSRERPLARDRQPLENHAENVNMTLPKGTELSSQVLGSSYSKSDKIADVETNMQDDNNSEANSKPNSGEEIPKKITSHKRKTEISMVETNVKAEPPDIEIPDDVEFSKENLHSDLGYDPSGCDQDSVGGDESGSAHGGNDSEFSENLMESAPQSVEDVVAQALPSSSSFQGNSFSLWEGENSLQNFPGEGFSGENSQGRQMVKVRKLDGKSSLASSSNSHTIPGSFPGASITSIDERLRATGRVCPDGETSFGPQSSSSVAFTEEQIRTAGMTGYASQSRSYSQSGTSFKFTEEEILAAGRICPVCHRVCIAPSQMRVHLRIHTGEKPYKCTFCSYQSRQKGNLVAHLKSCYQTNDGTKSKFQTHSRTLFPLSVRPFSPTKFYCPVCKKIFLEAEQFKNHLFNSHGISSVRDGNL